jgi:two-component system LytT family sensor kinase
VSTGTTDEPVTPRASGPDARVGAGASGRDGGWRPPLALAVPFAFWGMFSLFVTIHTYLSMLTHKHSFVRILLYEFVVSLFWIAATPLIARLARSFPLVPWRWRSFLVHAAAAALSASVFIVWVVAMTLAIRPYDVRNITEFRSPFLAIFGSQFPLVVLIYLGTLGAVYAYQFHERSRERALRAAQLEGELARSRLDSLAAQLQPHFLFNALHTVSGLIRGNEKQVAISTISDLSDILRYGLDASGAQDVPLREELEVTRRYLAIQALRFGERLTITIDADPDALATPVPRLLLQPLIENAIQHGVAPSASPSWLRVRATTHDGTLSIAIHNSVRAQASNGFGIGLRNARARLDQIYGTSYRLETRPLADRFELDLTLPRRSAADPPNA